MANSSAEMRAKAQKSGKKFEKLKDMGYDKYGIDRMEKKSVSDENCTYKKRK
jgi:hypothetical protein